MSTFRLMIRNSMIRSIVSLLASIFTAIQVVLFFSEKKGICFNAGCEIVDSLTTVPPVYFNVAGFFFFQTLFLILLVLDRGI